MPQYAEGLSGTGILYPFPRKHRIKNTKRGTVLFRFLWTLSEGIFYNRSRSVSYKIGIFCDTIEEQYIRKPMKEGIKWRSNVFF